MALELFKDELLRRLRPDHVCGCRQPATHLREDLLAMATRTEWDSSSVRSFEKHVWEIEWLFAPAVPVAEICLAAMADDIHPAAREMFADLLLNIVSATTTAIEVGGERDLVEECEAVIRPATWLFYAEVLAVRTPATAAHCFMILQELREDVERLRTVYRLAQPELVNIPFWGDNSEPI